MYQGASEAAAEMPDAPEPITNEAYQIMRSAEAQWLERHYDLNSIEGIKRIPNRKGLRCPATSGVTGQLYYYLRHKAYEYEKEGKMDLAIACMSKSSELAMLDYGSMIQRQELYPLVRILARNGMIEEAKAEKDFVDRYCDNQSDKLDKECFYRVISDAKQLGTDLLIMSASGSACPECAKYQGRVYSISGISKKYPKLPSFFNETGRVHHGCCHSFSPFFDGISDPMMKETLSVHPLKKNAYGRNIVSFSNRPFEDDRTDNAKAAAQSAIKERLDRETHEQFLEDHMIEREAERGQTARDFEWLQCHFPDKCPKSLSGYRKMRSKNTKNFQVLRQLASGIGKELR